MIKRKKDGTPDRRSMRKPQRPRTRGFRVNEVELRRLINLAKEIKETHKRAIH